MIQTIGFSQFCDAFSEDRRATFTYEGKRALFDYLEEYEVDCGETVELDIVALCCEYTEYANIEEVKDAYDSIKDIDDLRDNTVVIEFDGGIIIQDF